MNNLISISTRDDIPPKYLDSPVELLLEYHNLNRPIDNNIQSSLLIGMCMDNRIRLRIPDNFAFIIRSGGANLSYSDFKVSYAIAIGNVDSIVIIGHNKCGMVGLEAKKEHFVQGLVENGGWERDMAEEHFTKFAPQYEIGDEIVFLLSEAKRLRLRYPNIQVTPLFYRVEDNLLYLINNL